MQPQRQTPIAFTGVLPPVNAPKTKSAPPTFDNILESIAELKRNPSLAQLDTVLSYTEYAGGHPPPERRSSTVIVTSKQAASIIDQIAALCQKPQSPIQMQHWAATQFEKFRRLWLCGVHYKHPSDPTALVSKLCKLYVGYAKARCQIDKAEGIAVPAPLMPRDLVRDIVARLVPLYHRDYDAIREPVHAEMLAAWPRVGICWFPSWAKEDLKYGTPPLTEAIAKEAWRAASSEERTFLLPKLDLNWLDPDVAQVELEKIIADDHTRVSQAVYFRDRVAAFSKMSDKQFFMVLPKILQVSLDPAWTTEDVMQAMTSLPQFNRRIQLEKPVKETLRNFIPSTPWQISSANWTTYSQLINCIANRQATPEKGRTLIRDHLASLVSSTTAALQTFPAFPATHNDLRIFDDAVTAVECTASAAIGYPENAPPHGHGVAAYADDVVPHLRQLGALVNEKITKFDSGNPPSNLDHTKGQISERMKELFRALDNVRGPSGIKSALVKSGLVSLKDLRKKDLNPCVLSSTLMNHPERLAEIKVLADFKRVADMFDILVDIPPAAMKAASAAASQATDPLPDEKPAGRRRKMTA